MNERTSRFDEPITATASSTDSSDRMRARLRVLISRRESFARVRTPFSLSLMSGSLKLGASKAAGFSRASARLCSGATLGGRPPRSPSPSPRADRGIQMCGATWLAITMNGVGPAHRSRSDTVRWSRRVVT